MLTLRNRYAGVLVLSCVVAATAGAGGNVPQAAQTPPAAPATPKPLPPITAPSINTYPQIVRIRYIEGDVRVTRGAENEKTADTTWEQAVADLPLESGYNLATGTGRAEIEFEDASTMYLGENSALTFNDIHTTSGIPHTEITLLAGVLTVHIKPSFAGEWYLVKTPTDSISTNYPEKAYLRINSFLDAIAVTPQKDESFAVTGVAEPNAAKGQTVFFSGGKSIAAPAGDNPTLFADWDSWVATRVGLRSAATAAVAAASGLPSSTPGLADMNGQGAFFKCAPYGTCWEPPADPADAPAPSAAPGQSPSQGPDFSIFPGPAAITLGPGDKATTKIAAVGLSGYSYPVDIVAALPAGITCGTTCQGTVAVGQRLAMQFAVASTTAPGTYTIAFAATSGVLSHTATLTLYVVPTTEVEAMPFTLPEAPVFPCFPNGVRPITFHEHLKGTNISLHFSYGTSISPYGWAVCHTGTWIYRAHVYVWVAPRTGDRRVHHHPPVHWIKSKKTTGYVPFHPRDLKGLPPVNRKHDVYALDDKKGETVERLTFDPKEKVDVLPEPPKEFRKPEPIPLAHAEEPAIAAHELNSRVSNTPGAGSMLHFDKKSQGFVVVRSAPEPGHNDSKPVDTRPIDSRPIDSRPIEGHTSNLRTRNNVVARAPVTHVSTPKPTHIAAPSHAPATHAGGSHAGGGSHGGGTHTGGGHH